MKVKRPAKQKRSTNVAIETDVHQLLIDVTALTGGKIQSTANIALRRDLSQQLVQLNGGNTIKR